MNIESIDGAVTISLSYTNVKSLARMVELTEAGEPDPNCGSIHRMTQNGMLNIILQPDEAHYDRPEGSAGPAKDVLLVDVPGPTEEIHP